MKYKDPVTGEWKEIYSKTADTLPVGTVVEFEGEEVPAGWEETEEVENVITPNTDLNNYRETGIYFFSSSSVTPINIPSGSNGWLVVLKGNTNDAVKQIWFRFGSESNHFQTFVRTCLLGTWTEWKSLISNT